MRIDFEFAGKLQAFKKASGLICLGTLCANQGWAPRSFPFRTFRSFPFFYRMQRSFPFYFGVFGDLWDPKECSVIFRSFIKNGKECKDRSVFFYKERKRTQERCVLLKRTDAQSLSSCTFQRNSFFSFWHWNIKKNTAFDYCLHCGKWRIMVDWFSRKSGKSNIYTTVYHLLN